MSDNLPDPSSAPASASKPASKSGRKAESNRRNARKSTGPKTARGKSWSRLNALKHGILASQAVIATTEGRNERAMFDQLVDGLAQDFVPVGALEQTLVQQIAACFWRQRRLLRFENRAAFQSRETRTFRAMNEPSYILTPQYEIEGERIGGEDVLDAAGLGLDLPSEADTTRLIRYEGSITRSLKAALAQLKAAQSARRTAEAADPGATKKDCAAIIDIEARKRNRAPAAERMSSKAASEVLVKEMRQQDAERARRRAAEEAEEAEQSPDASENYQTKPNMPEDPEALLKHQRLMETANTILKLGESLAPKRGPAGD